MMKAILLTWNPGPDNDRQWTPQEWDELIQAAGRGALLPGARWSVGNAVNDIDFGDQCFLYRQGDHGRGIVARGTIGSAPYLDEHWDDPSRTTNYVAMDLDEGVLLEDRLDQEQLVSEIPEFGWKTVMSSGRIVHGEAAERLVRLWSKGRVVSPDGSGAGLGDDSKRNREVELAAMDFASKKFRADKCVVDDVSPLNLGWDLNVRSPGGDEWHVEVKGVSGPIASFMLTRNELRAAESDASWFAAVVVNALSEPNLAEFDGADVIRNAHPIQYKVTMEPK